MKKVLHITYDMRIGGTEMVIKNIIEGNNDLHISMSIFCIEEPIGPWGEELRSSGVKIISKARKPTLDFQIIFEICKIIKSDKINIVHCHQYTPWVYGVFASLFTKAKVIFTEHGRFYPDSKSWKRKLLNPLLTYFTRDIVAISEATKKALVEFEYIPEKAIKVIYNGISPLVFIHENVQNLRRQYGIAEHTIVFGTVARLDPIKNQALMLHAFAKVLRTNDAAVLLIVGDGEERSSLKELCQKLSIESNVIFTGFIPYPQDYISLIDIFLLTSLSEGTSMTLLEALSLSKPCIVTDAGGNAEIVEHYFNGIVIENNNVDELYESMVALASNKKLIAQFEKNSRKTFDSKFSQKIMSEKYNSLYQLTLNQKD